MSTAQFAGWVIGTAADCDMRVMDEYVSARHALVHRDGDGRVFVEDLGSTNGTYVQRPSGQKGKVTVPFEIHPGDVIVVGRTKIPWSVKT